LSRVDPLGLATWQGWARSISLGPFTREEYDLFSDCIDDLKQHIKVIVDYGGVSLGAIAQQWYAVFDDHFDYPNAMGFAGPAFSYSAGAAGIGNAGLPLVGWGASYSRTRIGSAESVGWSVVRGIGAGVGVSVGASSVEMLPSEKCCD